MKRRLVVPDVPQLKTELFDEAHCTRYTVHSSTTKMYKDQELLVKSMWKDVAEYVSKCFTCQQVKAEHRNQQVLCSPCPFWSGNGSRYRWTLLWGYRGRRRKMILSG